jgi:hypothetical protein
MNSTHKTISQLSEFVKYFEEPAAQLQQDPHEPGWIMRIYDRTNDRDSYTVRTARKAWRVFKTADSALREAKKIGVEQVTFLL